MQRSVLQQQAARENGAKSHGPVTPQGKAASSRNGIKHGLLSRDVVLPNEDPELWEALRQSFHDHWKPANPVEALLVDDLAATQWKLIRAESIETTTLGLEMILLEPEIEKSFNKIDETSRQALAFKSLADLSKALAALERHQTRLHRQYARTMKQLDDIVKSRPAPQPEPASQPEPAAEPKPEPAPEPQPEQAQNDKPESRRPTPVNSEPPGQHRPGQPARDQDSPPCRAA